MPRQPTGRIPESIEDLYAVGSNGHPLRAIKAALAAKGVRISHETIRTILDKRLRRTDDEKRAWHLREAERCESEALQRRAMDPAWADTQMVLAMVQRHLAEQLEIREEQAARLEEALQDSEPPARRRQRLSTGGLTPAKAKT